jgi:hypothetical protein
VHKKEKMMNFVKIICIFVSSIILIFGSVGQAATTYMNATTNNGALAYSAAGYWSSTPGAIPAGWVDTAGSIYSTSLNFVELSTDAVATNNTGLLVPTGQQFTVSAYLGGGTGVTAMVQVYATQNADGSGPKLLLAQVSRVGQSTDAYTLFPVSSASSTSSTNVAGYYVQVVLATPGYYGGPIVVTSQAATNPQVITYMSSSFHNGALIPSTYNAAWSSGSTAAIPIGWVDTAGSGYTTATGIIELGTGAVLTNNTGEQVPAGQQFTISAYLGGGAGTLTTYTATVQVYATQNIDGSGEQLLLAQISRTGPASDGYTLFPVSGTSLTSSSNVAGYYLQVVLATSAFYGGPVVVTSQEQENPATTIYMDAGFQNGALKPAGPSPTYGTWGYYPGAIPTGWTGSLSNYTTATDFIEVGTGCSATNNTGEVVPVGEAFVVSAWLGGGKGTTATVQVNATQNADGTGISVPLASVSRVGLATDPLYSKFYVQGAQGALTQSYVAGYYLQVMLATSGYYWGPIDVNSSPNGLKSNLITYMDATYHNGAMKANTYDYWSDPCAIPFGWSATDPNRNYTTATMFAEVDNTGCMTTNNTGEKVLANYQYTVQADLGGVVGCVAEAILYATQNADGTGRKIFLAEVNQPGVNTVVGSGPSEDVNGYTFFTVSGTGAPAVSDANGYYLQVALTSVGAFPWESWVKDVVVTANSPICGDANHLPPTGDLNQDCHVTFADFALLADQWLSSCTGPNWCNGADLKQVGTVNFEDLKALVSNWLNCTDPNPPCSYKPLSL